MAEIATADQEPTANVGTIKARRQRKRKMAQCRFCGWMLLATNLKQHPRTHNSKFADREYKDLDMASGEYATKPFWAAEKEHFDLETPEQPPKNCEDDDICQFLVYSFEQKRSSSWTNSWFGQVAHAMYYKKHSKNPVIRYKIKYSEELYLRGLWRRTV